MRAFGEHKTIAITENAFLRSVQLPDFTFFDVPRQFFDEPLPFHPVDDGPSGFAAVAEKRPAVQAQRHS